MRSMTNPNTRAGLLLASLLAAIAGCDADEQRKAPAPSSQAATEEPSADKPARPAVQAPKLSDIAAKVAAAAKKAQEAEVQGQQVAWKAAGPDGKVLKAWYATQALRFHGRDGQLGEDGRKVLQLLAELDRHGVDKGGYRLAQLDAATQAVGKAFEAERKTLLALEKHPRAALVAAAAALWVRGGDGGEVALARAGGDQLGPDSLLALDAAIGEVLTTAQKAREAVVAADLELSRATIRYVVDFQWGLPAHPIKHTPAAQIRRMSEQFADPLLKILNSPGGVAEALRKLWPTHPQYEALLGAYDEYKKLADGGGWKPLPKLEKKNWKKGETGPWVLALRERLRAEGYDAGVAGEQFDEALHEAVVTFQNRHMLDPDGVVGKPTVTELDVPAEQRVKQIQLALQRYRESEGRDPGDFYIFVNVAFQRLWVVDNGQILRTHKVIVGNNDVDTDQLTQMKGKINRTKLFSHKMVRVILAPKWFPTQRVVELELGPKLAKDPAYLEKEGYVREIQADGTEVWYQKAGKTNLLGDVKFQGPNKHNIYLHDTPFRNLFSKARRAFSHGCIRVHEPVDLAELLLERDKGMGPAAIRDAIKEKEEKEIKLKSPIQVHIDYASAGVDEEGHVVFGYDVYGYDQAFFEGALPVEEAKEYKAGSVKGL